MIPCLLFAPSRSFRLDAMGLLLNDRHGVAGSFLRAADICPVALLIDRHRVVDAGLREQGHLGGEGGLQDVGGVAFAVLQQLDVAIGRVILNEYCGIAAFAQLVEGDDAAGAIDLRKLGDIAFAFLPQEDVAVLAKLIDFCGMPASTRLGDFGIERSAVLGDRETVGVAKVVGIQRADADAVAHPDLADRALQPITCLFDGDPVELALLEDVDVVSLADLADRDLVVRCETLVGGNETANGRRRQQH